MQAIAEAGQLLQNNTKKLASTAYYALGRPQAVLTSPPSTPRAAVEQEACCTAGATTPNSVTGFAVEEAAFKPYKAEHPLAASVRPIRPPFGTTADASKGRRRYGLTSALPTLLPNPSPGPRQSRLGPSPSI